MRHWNWSWKWFSELGSQGKNPFCSRKGGGHRTGFRAGRDFSATTGYRLVCIDQARIGSIVSAPIQGRCDHHRRLRTLERIASSLRRVFRGESCSDSAKPDRLHWANCAERSEEHTSELQSP